MNELVNIPIAAGGFLGFLDPIELLKAFGYIGLFIIIFAESGLLIGFFLPGDSLLFTAGVLTTAAAGKLLNTPDNKPLFDITLLLIICPIAAIAGDTVGFLFGLRVGPRIFNKEDSLFFKKAYIQRAQDFYDKNGGKTIILARFIPIVRTFAPIVAGIGKMKYTTFLSYNVIGGLIWGIAMPLAGNFLGNQIKPEDVDKWLLPIIFLIILISLAPPLYGILKEKENRQRIAAGLRRVARRER